MRAGVAGLGAAGRVSGVRAPSKARNSSQLRSANSFIEATQVLVVSELVEMTVSRWAFQIAWASAWAHGMAGGSASARAAAVQRRTGRRQSLASALAAPQPRRWGMPC